MNCDTSKEYMMKYFDGETDIAEDIKFKEHLINCCSCSDEFRCMEAIFSTLDNKEEIEPPADFESRVMDKVAAIEQQRKEKSSKMIVWLYNGATLLSIILLLIFVADIKQVSALSAFNKLGEYFSSFSSTTEAITGAVKDIFNLLANAVMAVVDVAFSIVRSYYYVFITLLLMLFGTQRLLHYVGTHGGGEAE